MGCPNLSPLQKQKRDRTVYSDAVPFLCKNCVSYYAQRKTLQLSSISLSGSFFPTVRMESVFES